MPVKSFHEAVRLARVIDVVRAVSAPAAVKAPATVDFTNPQHPSMSTSSRFGVGNLLAGILGDLVFLFKGQSGEAPFAVNGRRLDC